MSLADVAERLARQPDGLQQQTLGDLQLAYLRLGDRRKLRIGREATYPTPEQVAAVLAAFHVPPEPTVTPGRMKSQAPRSGRWYTLHYYDVCWREHASSVPPAAGAR